MLDKSQKQLAYYQIMSAALITAGSVFAASWFVVITGGIVENKEWFFHGGLGMISIGLVLVGLGVILPIILIRRL